MVLEQHVMPGHDQLQHSHEDQHNQSVGFLYRDVGGTSVGVVLGA